MKAKHIKIINLIVAVLVALFAIGQAFAWLATGSVYLRQGFGGSSAGAYFAYGDGSKDDPFGINTKYHMYNLAWLQNTGRLIDSSGTPTKYYFELDPEMEGTLDMGDMWLPPIGNDDKPFMGEFNGNGKTLANLRITTDKSKLTANPAREDYEFSNAVGMFGKTAEGSEVANFILTNPIVEAASSNTKYAESTSNQVIGLAIGHVAGKCYSIGVRATKIGAQSTTLLIDKVGYSTFNSILGELGEGVESSVTGGGHVAGSGGSGNAFGASFDVAQLATRLIAIEANKGASPYLPKVDTKSDVPVPALGYKVAFTVDKEKSTYTGENAVEVVSNDNIGYDMGNQNKISLKKLNFTDDLMEDSNDGNHQYYLGGVTGKFPDNNHVPRWFYVQGGGWQNSAYMGHHGFAPISQAKYDSLPQNVKDLLTTTESIGVLRIQAGYTQYSSAPLYANGATPQALEWNYHGQISWMGNTYGKGFVSSDGYAVDEKGNYYTANGNLMGDDEYDRDETGKHYGVDLANNPNFPYIVYSIQEGASWDSAYALDEDGNRYYRYDPESSGEYVYGVLDNRGYLKTGVDYESYVASVAGWSQPITIIDANGYAMYAAGVYYDASGNIVEGAYVKDENGFYISADTAFNLPISQIIDGYAQDADGNYYGKITLNERTVYCYLGSDGKTAGYDGFYLIDENAFLVKANNVDGDGYVKYNDTDYYGTYDGISGYVDANGYFYDNNHVYVVTDKDFNVSVTNVDVNGYAMTSDDIYHGKYKNDYGYMDGTYFYTVVGEQKYYVVNDNKFTDVVNNIDESGYAMTSDGIYFGKYNNGYGYLDGTYFYTVAGDQKVYVVSDSNFSYEISRIDENGYAMTSDGVYYGKYDSDYGYLDGTYFYTLVDGQKVYVVKDGNFNPVVNLIDENGYAMASDDVYYGKYRQYAWYDYTYGYLKRVGNKKYLLRNGKYVDKDGNEYEGLPDSDGHIMIDSTHYYGVGGVSLDSNGYIYDDKGYYLDSSCHWSFNNYSPCEDEDDPNYGYFVDGSGNPYINVYAEGADQRVKAWGYTLEEINNLTVGRDEWNSAKAKAKTGTFIYAVEGEPISVETGKNVSVEKGTQVSVETGDYISVEKGAKTLAVSSDDINGLEGEFITPKEIEKVKVVTSSDKLNSVTVKKGSKVIFNNFSGGIALPNNGLWFKPSQAGTVRFVMLAQKDSEAFCLLKITRTLATKEDPFYSESGSDIIVEKVMQQQMPPYVLFYYEIDVTERDIENGNIEYCIMVDNNVKEDENEEGKGTNYKGAYFVYLDIGASAADDTSAIDKEKNVSAVDFIYEGVEIEQVDTTIGVGNFIVNTSGTKALYNSSKTSVYFENITKVLKIVFVRLNNDDKQGHSGKTICLEDSDPKLNKDSEVMATFATYVCPAISGGSGTVSSGGGGSGTVTPSPDPTPDPNPDPNPNPTPSGSETKTFESITVSNDSIDLGLVTLSKSTSGGESLALAERSVTIDGENISKYIMGKAMDITAGDTAVKVTVYVALSDSKGALKSDTLTVTGVAESYSYDSSKDYLAIEINIAANGNCTLTPNGSRRLNILMIKIESITN